MSSSSTPPSSNNNNSNGNRPFVTLHADGRRIQLANLHHLGNTSNPGNNNNSNSNNPVNPPTNVNLNGLRISPGQTVRISLPRNLNDATNNTSNTNNNTNNPATATATPTNLPNGATIRIVQRNHLHPTARVTPLQPQPLPTPTQNHPTAPPPPTPDSGFQCIVCLDYLNDPAGCGNCSGRFCYHCLDTVRTQQTQNYTQQPQQQPRCPNCRATFSQIHRDSQLAQRMDDLHPSIPCSHAGCDALFKLTQITQHERNCPFAILHCRYQAFGCAWTGRRMDLETHEQQDCSLADISTLVEQFRQLRADHTQRVWQLQQGVLANNRTMQLLERRILQQVKSTNDVLDLLHFCHLATCAAPQLIQTRDVWRTFYETPEGRAAVFNFLLLLPTTLLLFNVFQQAYQLLAIAIPYWTRSSNDLLLPFTNVSVPHEILEPLEMAYFTVVLGTTLILCFIHEGDSSVEWTSTRIPRFGPVRMVRNIGFVTAFAFYYLCFDNFVQDQHDKHHSSTNDGSSSVCLLWLCMSAASTFFPAVMARLSQQLAAPTNHQVASSNIMETGRVASPVLFGLRHGTLAAVMGLMPALDVAFLESWCQASLPHKLRLSGASNTTTSPSAYIAFLVVRPLILALFPKHASVDLIWIGWTACVLLLMNLYFNAMFGLGSRLGRRIASMAQTQVNQRAANGGANIRTQNIFGMLSFGAWVLLLSTISLS